MAFLRLSATAALAAAIVGCGAGEGDALPRQAVSGTVKLDGKPLPRGSITFDPVDVQQADAVSVGGTIEGGSYSIPQAQGPTPGTYRVSILASEEEETVDLTVAPGMPPPRKKAAPKIPAKYNAESTLKAEVKPGGTGPLDFDLASK